MINSIDIELFWIYSDLIDLISSDYRIINISEQWLVFSFLISIYKYADSFLNQTVHGC